MGQNSLPVQYLVPFFCLICVTQTFMFVQTISIPQCAGGFVALVENSIHFI